MLLDKIVFYGFLGSVVALCVWWMFMSFYIDFTFRPSKEVMRMWKKDRDWSAVIALGQDHNNLIRSALYTNHKNRLLWDNKINATILVGGSAILLVFFLAATVMVGLDITGIHKINLA